jgi:hypothetical protein
MCTLTIITRDDGYLLGMNRDESIHRAEAAPPSVVRAGAISAIYPRDSAGGTWIAANQQGIAFALLNWNDVAQPSAKLHSRGEVIPALIGARSLAELNQQFQQLDLEGIHPFRLVGVFPSEQAIREWRWNGERMESRSPEWKSQHWFSSSLSDAEAEAMRGAACLHASHAPDAGTSAWLRRLHASHESGPGPFSLCVHREGVRTLSYTEVDCSRAKVEFLYAAGSPCEVPVLSLRIGIPPPPPLDI